MSWTVEALSGLDQARFCEVLGGIYEHSPWVASRAWASRPFAGIEDLHRAMEAAVRRATPDEQLALIRAHPRLAGKGTRQAGLTAASRREQAGAGLDAASDAETARLAALNEAYFDTFGFPFILAVRGRSRAEILASLEERLASTTDREFARSLDEIAHIARFRLDALLGS